MFVYVYGQSPTCDHPTRTNGSYDQNFLMRISIQNIIKAPLKFHFELHFELCAQSFDYHNSRYWDNRKLNPPRPAGGCSHIRPHFVLSPYHHFDVRPGVQSILFASWAVPVIYSDAQ